MTGGFGHPHCGNDQTAGRYSGIVRTVVGGLRMTGEPAGTMLYEGKAKKIFTTERPDPGVAVFQGRRHPRLMRKSAGPSSIKG